MHFYLFLGKKKETHIKKPLNAFMLYMKEMRPVVQAECTLKESAAINQLLGRRVRKSNFGIYIIISTFMSVLPCVCACPCVSHNRFVTFTDPSASSDCCYS